MDKIDFSYMQYPDGSNGRVLGRRNEAVKLAKREYGDFEKHTHGGRNIAYEQAYFSIILEEAKLLFQPNNYRKMHGSPMRRRRRNGR